MKGIAILGSTGSIGSSALKVVDLNPESYRVVALGAGKNVDLLIRQAEKYHPLVVATLRKKDALAVKERLGDKAGTEVSYGGDGFRQVATMDEVDTVISAISGSAGFLPTYAAIEAGKAIALANKETMVMAGPLVTREAKKRGVTILPVDSEHSAILQSLQGHAREDLRRVIITGSGGPFRDFSLEEMEEVTPAAALRHPTWNMGEKITIDSATLMNKGLEAIEAKWLFDLRMDQISIVIHPQSIVHSMVEYKDGSIIAQMGIPDMITPISYALSYPRHLGTALPPLDVAEIGTLSFERPDFRRFPCLALAMRAAGSGESMPAVLNGANEVAVNFFLKGKMRFLDIPMLVERTMEDHRSFSMGSVEDVIEADQWARTRAEEILGEWGGRR